VLENKILVNAAKQWCCWGGLNSRPNYIEHNKNNTLYNHPMRHLVTLVWWRKNKPPAETPLPSAWLPDDDPKPRVHTSHRKVSKQKFTKYLCNI